MKAEGPYLATPQEHARKPVGLPENALTIRNKRNSSRDKLDELSHSSAIPNCLQLLAKVFLWDFG